MTTAWLVRAGEDGMYADRALSDGVVLFWWRIPVGDISDRTRAEIADLVRETRPEKNPLGVGQLATILDSFAHVMAAGDPVVMPLDDPSLVAIGEVTGEYKHRPEADGGVEPEFHTRAVTWIAKAVPREALEADLVRSLRSELIVFRFRQAEPDAAARLLRLASEYASLNIVRQDYAVGEWVYPVNETSPSWDGGPVLAHFAEVRDHRIEDWGLATGYRQIEPGDVIWVYASAPYRQIVAVGAVGWLDSETCRVGIEWDVETTEALLAAPPPVDVLEIGVRTVRRLREGESASLTAWLDKHSPSESGNDRRGRDRRLREVIIRQGQPVFRAKLMAAYGECCAISGCDVAEVLQAAHIRPYDGPVTNKVSNGLLLRADLHNLFDNGLLWVDQQYRVRLNSALRAGPYADLDRQPLRLPKRLAEWPDRTHLRAHASQAKQQWT